MADRPAPQQVSDNVIGMDLLGQDATTYPTITKTWVEAGSKVKIAEHGAELGIDVEFVTQDPPQLKGFSVVKRWWWSSARSAGSCNTAGRSATKPGPRTPPA